jgi:arylsulfatase
MLFNLNEDFSEANDVAAKNPAKLEQLKQLWFMQASKYKVFPVDSSLQLRLVTPRPQITEPRTKYIYYPGTGEVEADSAVDVRNRSYSISADVEIGKDGAKGVLIAHGGTFAGYSFFINKDQKLQFSHNYVAINEYKVISTEKVPTGKVALRMEFKKTGPPDFAKGKGSPGTVTLYFNDKAVGSGEIPVTCPLGYSLSGDGLSVGRDTLSAVSLDYMGSTFPFTGGVIRRVTVDIGNDQHPTPKPPDRD